MNTKQPLPPPRGQGVVPMATHPLTQDTFDRLPMWVSRSVFLEWSGLRDADLAAEVKAGTVAARHRPGNPKARAKYYKASLARITGFRCEATVTPL